MLRLTTLVLVGIVTLGVISCEINNLPEAEPVHLDLPGSVANYNVGVNDAIPTLGRVLFYDKQLSINNSVACGSCHKQSFAFADNVAFSRGFENRSTTRNSMPIQNLSSIFLDSFDSLGSGPIFFSQSLFWDGRESDLESLVLRPIINHVEMGITDLALLERKLQQVSYYPQLFTDAYGDNQVTVERISDAMSWFMRSIRSTNTKLDKFQFEGEQLTATELEGMSLFIDKYDCNGCHQVQEPNGYIFAGTFSNIGLDPVYADDGLGDFTRNEFDNGRFKIPSLRNVTLTGPYMHDGRFKTLSEVMEHYSTGIADHPSLDFRLKDAGNNPMKFNISQSEKQAIIAFLNTLTDYSMVTDSKLSDPFKSR